MRVYPKNTVTGDELSVMSNKKQSGRAGERELKKDGILTRESTAQNDGIKGTHPVTA